MDALPATLMQNSGECKAHIFRENSQMKNQSILGDEINPDTKIYRIMPVDRFFQLFEQSKNTLRRPRMWNDPFENVFLNSPVQTSDGKVGKFEFCNDVYAQCWTLEAASNAMWEIYSRHQEGIRIRTTVGKLINSLRAANGDSADATCFIGKVKYPKTLEDFKKFGEVMFKSYEPGEGIARSLLLKRYEFRYEKEVRLIHIILGGSNFDCYKYSISPLKIIDQAMVDGRKLRREEFNDSYRREISARTGLPLNQIYRSQLYDPPKGFVVYLD